VLDGIEESPDGGAAMAEAHLLGLPDHEREQLLERAAAQSGSPSRSPRRWSPWPR
jgi:hypothetical protein